MRGQGLKSVGGNRRFTGVRFHSRCSPECGIGIAAKMMLGSITRVMGERYVSEDLQSRFSTLYVHGNSRVPNDYVGGAYRRIGFLTWETTKAPAELARVAGDYTELWTPSEFSASAIRAAGVKIPIYVVPHIVKLNQRIAREGRPRILVQADGWSRVSRKRPEVALAAAALGSVGKDAEIVLKVHHMSESEISALLSRAEEIAEMKMPEITVISTWGDNFIEFLRGFHILVSATRGEAFGLPLLEAMANGVAVCAHDQGGQGEFLVGYIANATEVPTASSGDSYFKTGNWWDVNVHSLAMCVKRAIYDMKNGDDGVVSDARAAAAKFNTAMLDRHVSRLLHSR